jgi:hypothetical protein
MAETAGGVSGPARDDDEAQWINHDPHAEVALLEDLAREREALQMRIAGFSYLDIAEAQGGTSRDASRRVTEAIKREVPTELREEARALSLERLGLIIRRNIMKLSSSATTEDEKERAEDVITRVTMNIVEITGAKAPIQVDVRHHDALDAELDALVADLTRPVPPAPNVAPPLRGDDDRIDPDLSRGSGRWRGRMRRGDSERPDSDNRSDRGYDDPSVP